MNQLASKKMRFFIILSISPIFAFAAGKDQSDSIWNWALHNLLFIVSLTIIIGAFVALWNLFMTILTEKKRELNIKEPEIDSTFSIESIFKKTYDKLSGLIPLQDENDIMLDHDYDGIKELDNSLPPWWIYGFYISIIAAFAYIYVYHYSDIGLNQVEEYEVAMKEGERRKAEYAKRQANNIDEKNLVALADEKSLTIAMKEFKSKCAACHGNEGQGGVGPNLTDDYWIHGGSTPEIYKTIKYGVPEKGMIAWKTQLNPSSIHQVSSYILTLRGTNPPNPKASQGTLYTPEEASK